MTITVRRDRPVRVTLILILSTILLGLLVRFGPLGLPPFVAKYGGSALWAMMIYWIVAALPSAWTPGDSVLLAGGIATAVELFKLYHSPRVDAFRLTLPGILLLGRFFSLWDIFVYWCAVLVARMIDRSLRKAPRR